MSGEPISDLTSLLLDTADLTEEQIEAEGVRHYRELYLNQGTRGMHALHGGGEVVFFADRYEHAFRTSSDRARHQFLKDAVAISRVRRIRWIGPILRGEVPGTECWHVRAASGKLHPLDRLYVWWPENYVIWLTTRDNKYTQFKFSSAYVATPKDIRGIYLQAGSLQWRI